MLKISQLVNDELCTGCGLCVSEEPNSLKMHKNEFGFIVPQVVGEQTGMGVKVCPFNPKPEEIVKDEDSLAHIFLNEAKFKDDRIGHYENSYIGYSEQYRETSSSGGIATYVFHYLLANNIVDNLYIVKEFQGNYAYQLFTDAKAIIEISKTRYIPVTLDQLFLHLDRVEGKVAISGVACFIKAIRLKQHYNSQLQEKIPFLIGIICGGWKSEFFTQFLVQSSNIKGNYQKQEYRIKDENSSSSDYSFGAYDESNNFKTVKMHTVGDMWGTGLFKSKACEFCTDVVTELADISLGDAWLDQYRQDGLGNSIIVTRTKLADKIIQEGINNSQLNVKPVDKKLIEISQGPSYNHRQDAIKFRSKYLHFNSLKPYIRKRILKNISIPSMFVQYFREQTRKNSLILWKESNNVVIFNEKMRPYLKKLRLFTVLNNKYKTVRKRIFKN